MESRVSALNYFQDEASQTENSSQSTASINVPKNEDGQKGMWKAIVTEKYNEQYYAHLTRYELRRDKISPPQEPIPWDLGKRYVQIRNSCNLNLGELEQDGILTDRLIESCSSCLDRSPVPGKIILCTCDLSRKNLSCISIIVYHKYLQYLDLSRNKLTSVECLSMLPFLQYLDVSHNYLTVLLEFKPPTYLSYVDYSFNLIEEIGDLTEFWSIVHLNASNNIIKKIEGFDGLKYLEFLDISNNEIQKLENLDSLNIISLNLSNNFISEYDLSETSGLHTMCNLLHISIADNRLTSLELFSKAMSIETIDVSNNMIEDLIELTVFEDLKDLHELNMEGNPICSNLNYKNVCLTNIAYLRKLDKAEIDAAEKGALKYLEKHNTYKRANRHRATMDILKQLNTPEITNSVIPCYEKFVSIVILVGPLGCKKKRFLHHVRTLYTKFIKLGVSVTTRPPCSHEKHGKDYYFVSHREYRELLRNGKLICSSQRYGHHFGLAYDELRKISEEAGVLIFHCDLTSALQIRSRFINSKLVLTMPRDTKTYKHWLKKKFYLSKWISNYVSAYRVNYKNLKMETKSFYNVAEAPSLFERQSTFLIDQEEEDEHGVMLYSDRASKTIKKSELSGRNVAFFMDTLMDQHREEIMKSELMSPSDAETFTVEMEKNRQKRGGPTTLEERLANIRLSKITMEAPSIANTAEPSKLINSKAEYNQEMLNALNSPTTIIPHMETLASVSQEIVLNEKQRGTSLEDAFLLTQMSYFEPPVLKEEASFDSDTNSIMQGTTPSLTETTHDKYVSDASMLHGSWLKMSSAELEDMQASFEYFVDLQMERRKYYEKIYLENPGLFVIRIYTDEEVECQVEFANLLKVCVRMQQEYTKHPECYEHSAACKEMENNRLSWLHSMLD